MLNNKDIVLSDELLKEYFSFIRNETCNKKIIERLLIHFKHYLTNAAQLSRIGIDDSNLIQSLISSGLNNQPLEELCNKTNYKLILNTKSTNYPYLNIYKDSIESNYTVTYKNTAKTKTIEHLKALCLNAKKIFIYDKYIIEQNENTLEKISELFPKHSLTIFYIENKFSQKNISQLKRINSKWNIKKDSTHSNYSKYHDRYLIIDDKIEVIFTSGFESLFYPNCDLTCIIRKISSDTK